MKGCTKLLSARASALLHVFLVRYRAGSAPRRPLHALVGEHTPRIHRLRRRSCTRPELAVKRCTAGGVYVGLCPSVTSASRFQSLVDGDVARDQCMHVPAGS